MLYVNIVGVCAWNTLHYSHADARTIKARGHARVFFNCHFLNFAFLHLVITAAKRRSGGITPWISE